MGYYKTQNFRYVIGTESTPVTLTNSFNDNNVIRTAKGYNTMSIYVEYTPAEAAPARVELQFEIGPDDANLFVKGAFLDLAEPGETDVVPQKYVYESDGAGTTIKRRFFFEVADQKVRLSLRETTNSAGDPPASFGTARVIIQRNEEAG
jgi:hypothetical protein